VIDYNGCITGLVLTGKKEYTLPLRSSVVGERSRIKITVIRPVKVSLMYTEITYNTVASHALMDRECILTNVQSGMFVGPEIYMPKTRFSPGGFEINDAGGKIFMNLLYYKSMKLGNLYVMQSFDVKMGSYTVYPEQAIAFKSDPELIEYACAHCAGKIMVVYVDEFEKIPEGHDLLYVRMGMNALGYATIWFKGQDGGLLG